MNETTSGIDDLKHIRSMMERSSIFLSLSGFSGVIVGLIGIIASIAIGKLCNSYRITSEVVTLVQSTAPIRNSITTTLLIALLGALMTAFFFSLRKSKKKNLSLFNTISQQFAFHFFIPLLTGGLIMIHHVARGTFEQVLPLSLIFYGLSLVSASKYTLREVAFLGISVLGFGLLATLFLSYSLIFWALGFGVSTIGYGLYLYVKYEK